MEVNHIVQNNNPAYHNTVSLLKIGNQISCKQPLKLVLSYNMRLSAQMPSIGGVQLFFAIDHTVCSRVIGLWPSDWSL